MILAAIGRGDVADYVEALFLVYIILIFIHVLLTWVPRMPYNRSLRAVLDFVEETTDPYLNLFRRFMPPLGGGGLRARPQPDPGDHPALVVGAIVVGADPRVSSPR